MTKPDIVKTDGSFMVTEEVMGLLRVTTRTVYRLIRANEIPAVRVGRQWRIRRSDLETWLSRGRAVNGSRS